MRPIKFRGKRTDTGEWVYGYYFKDMTDGRAYHVIGETPLLAHEIIPETVGQFTGLSDKNGKAIYEGDIIQVNYIMTSGRHFIGLSCEVRWCTQEGSWTGWDGCTDIALPQTRQILIKGNIHDTPELLNTK